VVVAQEADKDVLFETWAGRKPGEWVAGKAREAGGEQCP